MKPSETTETAPAALRAPTFFIKSFGCQMNKADAGLLEAFFVSRGLRPADSESTADVVHVLTCCVRQKAEDKFFSYLGAMAVRKERRPGLVIGVGGCIPAVRDVRVANGAVDYVCGNGAPEEYADEITSALQRRGVEMVPGGVAAPGGVSRLCAVIRGCANRCAYCVVPDARGPERSVDIPELVAETKRLAAAGAREVVFLGQNALAYGADLTPPRGLIDVLRATHDIDGIVRLRFLTSHPAWVTPEFLDAMRELPKVCEHFHIPFQSGDDEILRRMNRRYTAAQYLAAVSMIRERFPNAGLTADAIVGFPGETDAQFENTLALIRDARMDALYSFKYSPRPNTPAAKWGDDVPESVKDERLRRLNEEYRGIALELNEKLLNTEQETLVEEILARDVLKYRGRTRSNKVTEFTCARELKPGDLASVRIERVSPFALVGVAE